MNVLRRRTLLAAWGVGATALALPLRQPLPLWAQTPGQRGVPQVLPIEARWCLQSRESAPQRPCIQLEVADDHNERRIGLMHRPPLPEGRGMWFRFDRTMPISMWMLNTPSSLDMVFIHRQRVLAIERHVPPCRAVPCPTYFSDRDGDGNPDLVDWVIELRAGAAERLGLALGDPVTIEPVPAPSR